MRKLEAILPLAERPLSDQERLWVILREDGPYFHLEILERYVRADREAVIRLAAKVCQEASMGDYHRGLRADGAAMCAKAILALLDEQKDSA